MEEPHIRRGPGREEGMLTLLVDTARGVQDIPTRGEGLHGARVGRRRPITRGEEGRGAAELDGGEGERESEGDTKEGEAEEEGGRIRQESDTEGDRHLARPPGSWRGSGEEREAQRQVLGALRDLSEDLAERVSAWREALRGAARMLGLIPSHEGGSLQTCPTDPASIIPDLKGEPIQDSWCPDDLHSALLSAQGDMRSVNALLSHLRATLDGAISTLYGSEAIAMPEAGTRFQTSPLNRETSGFQSCPGCRENPPSASKSHDALGLESGQPLLHVALPHDGGEEELHADCASCSQGSDSRGVSDLNSSRPQAGLRGGGEAAPQEYDKQRGTGAERQAKIEEGVTAEQETDIHKDIPLETDKQRERQAEGEEERQAEGEEERHGEGKRARGGESKLVTWGLTGRSTNGQADVPNACYVTAPVGVAEVLTCEVVETLSSLTVIGSEELVSSVIRVKVQDGCRCPFPVTISVPFRARYRGNYRDVVVKVIDGDRRVSYISPVSTEGTFEGQRGSFAQVRVYALGLFAVLSCLKRESYTVPGRGLSIKLSMDPRVCLDYLPGSFTAPVVVQSMIQPVDAALLSSLKSQSDLYYLVISTTPLLHLTHPTSQPLRRPLSLTMPCPPNADKRREAGRGEDPDRPISVALPRDKPGLLSVRALSASAQSSRESTNELLVLLGWREEQWNILEKTTVRNLQNGLVSFELTENFERLMVTRLLSSVRSSHLLSLVADVEASVHRTMVTVVLQRRRDDPQAAMVAVFPSRDLGWELSKLRAQAYCGPPEPSQEIPMCEGEQLLLSFNGNITSTEHLNNQSSWVQITFHSQRKNRLFLRLTEVDPFGNYSSPHYKGTAVFHKVARGQLEQRGDEAVPSSARPPDEPVCKLSVTLPKKVRSICRPVSAKVKLCDETESPSDAVIGWLSQELSEEDLALLVLSLRLRRSSIQMVRLQAPDSLPAQALHILGLWRRSLPAAPQPSKSSQLAHCLARSGRPDLAKELLLRQAATRGGSRRALGETL